QGAFSEIAAERHQDIIDLNISGLTAMLRQFLPDMLARGSGKIVNVASIAAFQPIVGLASYAASKAYVLSLSEALAEECRAQGVTVTALCPGITATNMIATAADKNPSLSQIPDFMIGDAATVADEAYEACMQGRVIQVPGVLNLAGTLLARATPKWLVRRVVGVLGRKSI
ncbi:MAG: SDR family NAD(P)-dependent oxidoreductase, partial [Burkholderiales bacterium]|nr:SDR family NAD(P)-dependent oxidoreductase [Burkholderiales bacterium]